MTVSVSPSPKFVQNLYERQNLSQDLQSSGGPISSTFGDLVNQSLETFQKADQGIYGAVQEKIDSVDLMHSLNQAELAIQQLTTIGGLAIDMAKKITETPL
jgi:hypothetical protein